MNIPFSIEAENYLIGTVIAFPKSWPRVSHIIPDDFYQNEMGLVWDKIREFMYAGRSITPIFLSNEIYQKKEDKDQLSHHLMDWSNSVLTPNPDEWAELVKDLSERRRIISVSNLMIESASDTSGGLNAAEIAAKGISEISKSQNIDNEFLSAHDLGEQIIESLDKVEAVTKTGFIKLDEALGGGFYRNKFYGFAARMKSGKSLFMATIARNMAMNGGRVLYISLEMAPKEAMQRVLSMGMGGNSLEFLNPNIRTQPSFKRRVSAANTELLGKNLYFRAGSRMTLDSLKTTIARAAMSGLVDGIIVDYIQLVEGKPNKQSLAEHYDNVAQTLAEATKRYDIWIMSAAQLNQEGNIRGGEGLLNACDITYAIHKIEGDFNAKIPDRAWLEMKVSRYTPYCNIGTEAIPSYEIDVNCGPMFVELK